MRAVVTWKAHLSLSSSLLYFATFKPGLINLPNFPEKKDTRILIEKVF
jgi:hypothetical protein